MIADTKIIQSPSFLPPCSGREGKKANPFILPFFLYVYQVKSLDVSARGSVFVEKIPEDILNEVIDIIITSVELI